VNRTRLELLNSALLDLHKVLIDAVRAAYEQKSGPVRGPFELLRLLTTDPYFAWLRPLSRLLADVDELLERAEPFTDVELGSIGAEVRSLVEPCSECPTTFSERYLEALQGRPEVVLAHGRVAKALADLPRCCPASATLSEMLSTQRAARKGRRN